MRAASLVALGALALPANAALRAQGLDPSPVSFCGDRGRVAPVTAAATDPRVLVRFTTGVSATADEAIFARALGNLTADRVRQAVDVDVRGRGFAAGSGNADANAAVAEGRVLGVRFVLVGTVQSIDDRYVVAYRLVDARSGKELTNGSISKPVVAIDSLVDAMTATLTRAFGKPTYVAAPYDRVRTPSRTALLRYLGALVDVDAFDRERLVHADSQLRAAIQDDPTFTAARFRLADVLVRQLDWVEEQEEMRKALVRDGLWNVGHALLRDPLSPRALSLMGRLHLHEGALALTGSIVAALDRVAPGSTEAVTLRAQWERASSRDSVALEVMRRGAVATERSAVSLNVRADLERRVGDPKQACRALNRAVALDPLYAPAYVWRAVVRTTLGERREAWADAEVATRLGREDWGELTGAWVDLSARDTLRAKERLDAHMSRESLLTAGWLDLLLRAGVAHGLQKPVIAQQTLRMIPCKEPRRPQLQREPLIRFLRLPVECGGKRPVTASR